MFFLFYAVQAQHPALEIAKKKLDLIEKNSKDIINDSNFIYNYTDYIFYLAHFRDSSTKQQIERFENIVTGSKINIAKAYTLYCWAVYYHFMERNYKLGLTKTLEANKIFEAEHDLKGQGLCHARASAILLWQSAQEKFITPATLLDAVTHANRCIEISYQIKDTNLLCTGLMFAANNYLVWNKNDTALALLKKAEKIALHTKLNYPVDNNVWGTLSEIYFSKGERDSAIMYANMCLVSGMEQRDLYCLSSIWELKGKLLAEYSKSKNIPLGIKYMLISYQYATELADISVMARVENSLYNAYKAAHKQSKSLEFLERLNLHNDIIRKQNETGIKSDYELSQRQQQIGKLENESLLYKSKRQTLMIWLLSLAILIAIMGAIFLARNYYLLRQKKKEIEAALKKGQNIERKRMAADLHDNLGVQASAILHSATILKESPEEINHIANNLHDTAKDMLIHLRETLWAMKSTEIQGTELWIRMISFIKQIGNHYKHISFGITGAAPSTFMMDSPRALHILMIVQEAINNATKHANAKKVDLISLVTDNTWTILIKDDGTGFNTVEAKEKKDSYGLQNIIDRSKAANANVEITSSSNTGTVIELTIDTEKNYPNGL